MIGMVTSISVPTLEEFEKLKRFSLMERQHMERLHDAFIPISYFYRKDNGDIGLVSFRENGKMWTRDIHNLDSAWDAYLRPAFYVESGTCAYGTFHTVAEWADTLGEDGVERWGIASMCEGSGHSHIEAVCLGNMLISTAPICSGLSVNQVLKLCQRESIVI